MVLTPFADCRALATLQVVSGYRFLLRDQQAVESADSLIYDISHAPDSYLEKYPDSADDDEPELTFQALLQPGAGARGHLQMEPAARCAFPTAFDCITSMKSSVRQYLGSSRQDAVE